MLETLGSITHALNSRTMEMVELAEEANRIVNPDGSDSLVSRHIPVAEMRLKVEAIADYAAQWEATRTALGHARVAERRRKAALKAVSR